MCPSRSPRLSAMKGRTCKKAIEEKKVTPCTQSDPTKKRLHVQSCFFVPTIVDVGKARKRTSKKNRANRGRPFPIASSVPMEEPVPVVHWKKKIIQGLGLQML